PTSPATQETTSAPAPETPAPPASATPTATSTTPAPAGGEATPPQVQAQLSQGASRGGSASGHSTRTKSSAPAKQPGAGQEPSAAVRAGQKAVSPSTLTPSLPLDLRSSIGGVPSFFIESFRIPPFLLPIYQAAGTAFGIPWQVLAAINEVETDYGRDLSVSSAGAEGWMQFLPSSWAQYGVDANGDGFKDPYNPADAIFAAARYLRAAGGEANIRAGIYAYNHSQAYVDSVMLRAELLGGTPSELLGAITGLTEAHFPVHAAAHFSDSFPSVGAGGSAAPRTLVGTTIYAAAGAPVIAVQDGKVVALGRSATLGRFVALRDAFGNTYTYAQLGDVAAVYPVLQPHVHSTVSNRISQPGTPEPVPSGPATAGAQPRSPLSPGATVSDLALGAAAGLEATPVPPAAAPAPAPVTPPAATAKVKVFHAGVNDVYLHPLRAGAEVIAGTVLGHIGAPAASAGLASDGQPHILFQIRPAGAGAPLIDPKPILDGWVALENTSIFRAKGENPFLATSPSTGQVLLESKQQLGPQVLHDGGIRLGRCGRADVQAGRVDKRVLTMLEYLSVSGLKPTVAGLPCSGSTPAALAANPAASASSTTVLITAVNGIPVAGHQGAGSITDFAVRKLLSLQGLARPRRIVSALSYPGTTVALASTTARDAIRVAFAAEGSAVTRAAGLDAALSPSEWIKLTARLGEIPDPTVARAPSAAAIPTHSPPRTGAPGGNG
ncbi:MAG TPA: lytic murein transglycosylase, partial [Solirubrobacteraceae bacterium]|nr:lytic murein transglycosylase [Solirubrobacteraceae bacterium]